MLKISVGCNNSTNPWSENNKKILNGEPKWVSSGFYQQYKCIERLIIVASKNKYDKSGKAKEFRYC